MMKSRRCFSMIVFLFFLLFSEFIPQAVLAQSPQEILKSIPSDVPSIFCINMNRFAKSPLYAKIMREKQPMSGLIDAISSFSYSTGVDLANDLSYLVLSSTKQGPVMVASGRFDHERIGRYLRCSMYPKETNYKGVAMLIFPPQAGSMGVAMIDRQLIAVGRQDQLKSIADTYAGRKKSVMSNAKMAAIIGSGPSNEMIWFAGTSGSLLRNLSIHYPMSSSPVSGTILMSSPTMISSSPGVMPRMSDMVMASGTFSGMSMAQTDSYTKTLMGSFEIAESITGRFVITAISAKKATELANQWNPSAFVKMQSQDAGSFLITRGLMVNLDQSQLDVFLNVPANAIESFWKLLGPSDSGGARAPIPFLKPMPPVTEEAKKAKLQGTMQVSMLVRKDGTATNVTILKPLGYGMENSAIATITDFWRFLPALNNNRPIEAQTTIDIPLTYQDNRWK
jgi:TonB family protein